MADATAGRYLLDGTWFPVTHGITFLEADAETCARVLVAWRGEATMRRTGGVLRTRRVEGALPDLLTTLLPLKLTSVTRYLLLPTEGDRWTALLDNAWRGSEPVAYAGAFPAQPGGMRAVGVVDVPHTFDARTRSGWFGSRAVAVYEPDPGSRWGVRGSSVSVSVADTGRRWELDEPGEGWPLPDPVDRTARRVQDRLSRTAVLDLVGALGIRAQDDAFYAPDGWAILVDEVGGHDVAGNADRSLRQAQEHDSGA